MKYIVAALLALFPTLAALASGAEKPAVIPAPQKMEMREGVFTLHSRTRIYADPAASATGKYLREKLQPATGYSLPETTRWPRHGKIPTGDIFLTLDSTNTNLGSEGYEMTVRPESLVIRAATQAGLFYGVQTLLQLLPPEIYSSNRIAQASWQIPCLQIEDWPRFQWRGLMLDVSRHFFTKSEVESYLDAMALQKMNVFHWHLTDDQGWRIQIKKYPKLTQVGAWRANVGFGLDSNSTTAYDGKGRYGGFYTQHEIRDVVKYAAALHITIVPEIEMPGHASAALAAYPEFSCTGEASVVPTNSGIFTGIYDPAKEGTYQFLSNILTEVVQLFPGRYLHIGGDEVRKETWKNSPDCQALIQREHLKDEEELQSWFVRRMEKIINADGRALIGWSEILQGGLPQNAAVMDWIGGAKEAAEAGHNVVMSPTAYCYLDFYQSSNHLAEPKAAAWGKPLTLEKMYSFEPLPTNVPPSLQSRILGAQGNLWTEQVPNLKHAQYMTFPRACALAEVTWSAKDARDWNDFMRRVQIQSKRFNELNINYRKQSIEPVLVEAAK